MQLHIIIYLVIMSVFSFLRTFSNAFLYRTPFADLALSLVIPLKLPEFRPLLNFLHDAIETNKQNTPRMLLMQTNKMKLYSFFFG